MHTLIYEPLDKLWTVGYYKPDGKWYAIEDYTAQTAAEAHVNYLNGGNKQVDVCLIPE